MIAAAQDETGRHSHAAALGAAGWLGLAAAPTFAIMALLISVLGGDTDMMCSVARGAITVERNGPNVSADERIPFGALAETDLQPMKRCPPVIANGFAPLALTVFSCSMSGSCIVASASEVVGTSEIGTPRKRRSASAKSGVAKRRHDRPIQAATAPDAAATSEASTRRSPRAS